MEQTMNTIELQIKMTEFQIRMYDFFIKEAKKDMLWWYFYFALGFIVFMCNVLSYFFFGKHFLNSFVAGSLFVVLYIMIKELIAEKKDIQQEINKSILLNSKLRHLNLRKIQQTDDNNERT